eukprot:gnl/MRDRNA2_/MRDRNA2_165726_c0_seq1.p1 gnl/MRDRNA2_/MRDRNA2_165726_c0~~gnl/MRDRNA2_/MRDRNA2_165726_c0_seq1.p1  ORF type:complete len:392 (+),score=47.53 gnl/MRDRNA2_/MRDRNA2_165726_c0_seq1:42-1178(+)
MTVLPLSSTYYDLSFINGCWELLVIVGAAGIRRASDLDLDINPRVIILKAGTSDELCIRIPAHAQVDVDQCAAKISKGILRLLWPPALGNWTRECILRTVSSSPFIVVAEDFLDFSSCMAIIETAKNKGHPKYALNNVDVKYLMDSTCQLDSEQKKLMECVNSRVNALCGTNLPDLPRTWNPKDDPPQVHFLSPQGSSRISNRCMRTPVGLHVDSNGRPFRFVTVIIYLATLPQPSGDGATIFPCADVNLNDKTREVGRELLKEGIEHTTILGDEQLKPLAEALEKAALDHHGLSVFPVAGKMVLFFTMCEDGMVDPASWHGTAVVGSDCGDHGGKWILQYFKEVPTSYRANIAQFMAARRKLPDFVIDGIHHKWERT